MSGTEPDQSARFGLIVGCARIWVISAVHGEVGHLEGVHDAIQRRLRPRDALIYLGNMIGRGEATRQTIEELLSFRRRFLAQPTAFAADLVFLRGSQEEMWHKLLELQFAHNPGDVLGWMLEHGLAPMLAAYAAEPQQGFAACREGPVAITRWTSGIRAAINAAPGHANLLTALRRAAFTGDRKLLFVHAGIDVSRPIHAQHDSFWWGGSPFFEQRQPYSSFTKVIRGFDRGHAGLQINPHFVSIDRGCGFGGPLACACLSPDGEIVESFEG